MSKVTTPPPDVGLCESIAVQGPCLIAKGQHSGSYSVDKLEEKTEVPREMSATREICRQGGNTGDATGRCVWA